MCWISDLQAGDVARITSAGPCRDGERAGAGGRPGDEPLRGVQIGADGAAVDADGCPGGREAKVDAERCAVADVQATLTEKLGVDGEPYLILGACNPPLAHRALTAEPDLGTLLPCNVVVYQRDGTTHISAVDADRMLSLVGKDALAAVAAEVRTRLATVVERAA